MVHAAFEQRLLAAQVWDDATSARVPSRACSERREQFTTAGPAAERRHRQKPGPIGRHHGQQGDAGMFEGEFDGMGIERFHAFHHAVEGGVEGLLLRVRDALIVVVHPICQTATNGVPWLR